MSKENNLTDNEELETTVIEPSDISLGEVYAHRPFGTVILQTVLQQELVDHFNAVIDKIVEDKEKSKSLDWSDQLVGKTFQEFSLPDEAIEPYAEFFHAALETFVNQIGVQNDLPTDMSVANDFSLESSWVVRSFKGDYNPVHKHTNGDIVCIGYLKIPKWEEEMKQDDTDHYPANGQIDFLFGNPLPYAGNIFKHRPRVGDFFIIPAWLQHAVYPFKSDGERRSFSFNIKHKEVVPDELSWERVPGKGYVKIDKSVEDS